MNINFSKISFLNFYKAIIIAFFFSFIFPTENSFNKCLWVKSEELDNRAAIQDMITNAYRSGSYSLDVHNPGSGNAAKEDARIGLAPSSSAAAEGYNHIKLFHSLLSGSIVMRDEEDQTSVSYFCRVRANEMNFSNNPSFASGSENKIRHTDMHGNPTVYITGVNF